MFTKSLLRIWLSGIVWIVEGGALRRTMEGLNRPKIKVTRPASLSSFDHGSDAFWAGTIGAVGLGSDGLERWGWARRDRLTRADECSPAAVKVSLGTVHSEDMTRSAKSSNPGMP